MRSLYVEAEPAPEDLSNPTLEFSDVFRIYRSGPTETVALRGLDLAVDRGELVALLGPSGCGKSTALSLAAGLDEPSAGDVRVLGRSLARMDENERAGLRAREIAIVFQSDNLWPNLSVLENVALCARLAGSGRSARGEALEALSQLGLGERARHRPGQLSGGEQQRAALAVAACRRASLVLADEPTGELDAANEQVVLGVLRQLVEEHGSTVMVVTHSEQVAAAADRVVELSDGRVVR